MFNYTLTISLFHLIVVVPTLLYVGFKGKDAGQNAYNLLLLLGILLAIFHTYRALTVKSPDINIMHLLFIAPLILYIGYMQQNSLEYTYYLLIGLGLVALYIHGSLLANYLGST